MSSLESTLVRLVRLLKAKKIPYRVRICSPEDLIIHKIISDRPRDWEDVRGIINLLGSKLDQTYLRPKIKELTKTLEKPDLLKFYKSCFHKHGMN